MKKILFYTAISFLLILGLGESANAQTSSQTTNYQNTASPSYCYQFRYYLVRGSTDASSYGEVSRLQNILYNMRLLSVAPTGYFGSLTEQAVMQYQSSRRIQPTGTVGPITRQALSSCNNTQVPPPSTSSSTNVVPVTFFSLNQKSTLQIPLGTILNLPTLTPKATLPGYTFNGWFLDQNYSSVYTNFPIISPVNFFAKWIKACSTTNNVVYPNDCNGSTITPPPANTGVCTSNQEFSLNKNNCSCANGFVKITYGDPAEPTAICLPRVASCPADKYFYSWDYPGCACPQGFSKQSGIPGIDENIDHCVPVAGNYYNYPTTNTNTSVTTTTESTTYTPIGDMKECVYGSDIISIPVEIDCPVY